MKVVRLLLLVTIALLIAIAVGISKPEYAKKEGKTCSFCHVGGKPPALTEAGKYYKEHNHSLKGYEPAEQKKG